MKKQGEVLEEKFEALKTSLIKNEVRHLREKLDCWHSNARTVLESHQFKSLLATYYNCTRTADTQLKCMLTNTFYPRNEVRASHLVKKSTNGDTMHLYDLPSDIDHVRNGLLLLDPIEQAFDRKDICFLYDPLTNELIAKVLNPSLMTEPLSISNPGKTYPITYGALDSLPLQLPPGIFPYRRVLSMHAKFAYSRALTKGWIIDSEILDSYFTISDAGLKEPAGLGELTWQEVHSTIHHIPIESSS
mmetsp:Transcript_7687/g.8152  ORF Transcript_7687/g.8152 Transcript_7687/m.8152 type:complete len:246 (+) Transcript_7687:101-838(+)